LVTVLKSTTPEQRYESLSWFVYNLFGSTLPIWLGGYILLPIISKHFRWTEFSQHGELALYSAAFLAPTLRLIGKDVEGSVFVRRQTFLFFGWIFLTAAVALYSGVLTAAAFPPNIVQINGWLLLAFSLSLFIVSILFSSLVRLVDFQRIYPKEIFSAQIATEQRLEKDFDAITPAVPTTTEGSIPGEEVTSAEFVKPEDKLNEDFDSGRGADDGPKEN